MYIFLDELGLSKVSLGSERKRKVERKAYVFEFPNSEMEVSFRLTVLFAFETKPT